MRLSFKHHEAGAKNSQNIQRSQTMGDKGGKKDKDRQLKQTKLKKQAEAKAKLNKNHKDPAK